MIANMEPRWRGSLACEQPRVPPPTVFRSEFAPAVERRACGHPPCAGEHDAQICAHGNAPTTPAPPTPMHVLMIAPEPFYQDRGTPIALKYVLETLSEGGNEVDLLTYPMGETVELTGLRTLRISNPFGFEDVPIGLSLRKLVLDVLLIFAMARRLWRHRYDCIHAVEEAAFPAVVLGRLRRTPVIYDMQSSLPVQLAKSAFFRAPGVRHLLRACERWLIRKADAVVCSSGLLPYVRAVSAEVPATEWYFPGQQTNTSPAAASALRKQLSIPAGSRVVLYSGSFAEYQGLDMLREAAAVVLSVVPDAVFVLVGASVAVVDAKFHVASEHEHAFRFVPRQPRAAVGKYLAIADVAVSPRVLGDNLPLKIFDYMAAGKAIVATDCVAHRSVLDDERAVLAEQSAAAFGRAIVEVLTDPQRAISLGCAARNYEHETFRKVAFQASLARVYEGAVGSRTAAKP